MLAHLKVVWVHLSKGVVTDHLSGEELPLRLGHITSSLKADYVYAEKNLAVVNEKKSVSL